MELMDRPRRLSRAPRIFAIERAVLHSWSVRRWVIGIAGGIGLAILVSIPTVVLPNPFFTRSMAVTWWSYPVVIATGLLGALLLGSYVRDGAKPVAAEAQLERSSRLGLAGATLSFFAIGCPVCNKLVLLALGASGTMTWFAPFQPVLAIASVALMAVAVRMRLRNQVACAIPTSRANDERIDSIPL
jgi:hypothetical protein